MKISTQILVLFVITLFGCSHTLDSYEPRTSSSGSPTDESSKQKKASAKKGKSKRPATQKPYKIKGVRYKPIASAKGFVQTGIASWYGKKFHGRKTANGERYDMYAMTAAHKTLPMGTWVRVHNLRNNREIVVRINDRGPFVRGRIIDLSLTGAKKIGVMGPGTAKVRLTALGKATAYSKKTKDPTAFKPVNYWKGNFTVQVGAFKVKANAKKYRTKLSRRYQNAHIRTYRDHRGTFYRVRIGRFTNSKDAERFSEKIVPEKFEYAFVVAE